MVNSINLVGGVNKFNDWLISFNQKQAVFFALFFVLQGFLVNWFEILKAYIKPVGYRLTILSILLLFIGAGCSLTRRLKDNEALVRKITIKGVDKEFADAAVLYVDKEQQPNNVINLQFYYLFSKNGKKDIGEPPAILDSGLVEFSRIQIERFLQNKGYLKAKVTDSIIVKRKRLS